MNLLDWLLIETPDGATYLQVLLIFTVLFLLVKHFVLPDLKKIQKICEVKDNNEEKE